MSEGFLESLDLVESFRPLKSLPWPLVSVLAGIVASRPLLQFGRQVLTLKATFFLEKNRRAAKTTAVVHPLKG